jgi:hypothetical protein
VTSSTRPTSPPQTARLYAELVPDAKADAPGAGERR